MEIFDRLKAAFREYRSLRASSKSTAAVEHAIVFYAGWLGHYVADGSQPLHTTIYYNGWVGPNSQGYTTEHGIYAMFETTYVAQNVKAKDFARLVHSPEQLTQPFKQYVDYLKDSNKQVETVYRLHKSGGFNGKGSPEAFEFTVRRLVAGSQMLLNLWYTAWLDSAVHPKDRSGSAASVTEQIDRLKLQNGSFQRLGFPGKRCPYCCSSSAVQFRRSE